MKTSETPLDQALDALLSDPIETHFEPRDEFTQYRLTRQIVEQANAPVEMQSNAPLPASTTRKAPIALWMVAATSLICSASALFIASRKSATIPPPTQPMFAPAAQTPQVAQPTTHHNSINTLTSTPTNPPTNTPTWRVSQAHPSLGLRPGEQIGANQSIQTTNTPITVHARSGHVLTLLPSSEVTLNVKANTLTRGAMMVRATGRDAIVWRLDKQTTIKAQNATFALTQQTEQWQVDILQGSVQLTHQNQQTTHHHGRLTKAHPNHVRTLPKTTARRMRLWQRQHQLLGNANHTHGTIELSSKPSTRVLINQVDMGTVPLAMTMEPGLYQISFVDVGKKTRTHKQHVRVMPNKHQRLSHNWPETTQKTDQADKPTQAATPTATLAQAQAYDMAKQWHKAAEAYEQVLQRPHAPSLKIHVGWLYTRQLHAPKHALRHFEGYLQRSPNGPLAQEALKGQVAAHRALQAPQQEARALKQLLKRYPNTVGAAKHKKRLNEIYKGLIKR